VERQEKANVSAYSTLIPLIPQVLSGGDMASHICGRMASSVAPNSFHKAYYCKRLASISLEHYVRFGQLDDLDKAIWQYEKVHFLSGPFGGEGVVLRLCLCYALYRRFIVKGGIRDLVHFMSILAETNLSEENEPHADDPVIPPASSPVSNYGSPFTSGDPEGERYSYLSI